VLAVYFGADSDSELFSQFVSSALDLHTLKFAWARIATYLPPEHAPPSPNANGSKVVMFKRFTKSSAAVFNGTDRVELAKWLFAEQFPVCIDLNSNN